MRWNEIERYIKKYPKCELCYKESVHRIERFIRIPELDYRVCLKLTAPQYMKASAYFEDKPFYNKTIDGVFEHYRRKP